MKQNPVSEKNKRMKNLVPYSESHRRIGTDHPRAVYTESDVEHVLYLRSLGWSYSLIAAKMEMPRATVWSISCGRTRAFNVRYWRQPR